MKKYLSDFKRAAGFTLIELLVVIGILGVLAAALVATIDPFEQLKKAQDTTTVNALTEWLNGTTRYYTTHLAYPWDEEAADCFGGEEPSGTPLYVASGTDLQDCTDALVNDNELKTAFTSSPSLQYILITYDSDLNQVIGCFNPASKSMLHNANTKYNSEGDLDTTNCGTDALKDTHPTSCYWCTR